MKNIYLYHYDQETFYKTDWNQNLSERKSNFIKAKKKYQLYFIFIWSLNCNESLSLRTKICVVLAKPLFDVFYVLMLKLKTTIKPSSSSGRADRAWWMWTGENFRVIALTPSHARSRDLISVERSFYALARYPHLTWCIYLYYSDTTIYNDITVFGQEAATTQQCLVTEWLE